MLNQRHLGLGASTRTEFGRLARRCFIRCLVITVLIAPDGEQFGWQFSHRLRADTDQERKISLYLKAMVYAGSETPISSPSTTNSESFFERLGAVCSLSDCGN